MKYFNILTAFALSIFLGAPLTGSAAFAASAISVKPPVLGAAAFEDLKKQLPTGTLKGYVGSDSESVPGEAVTSYGGDGSSMAITVTSEGEQISCSLSRNDRYLRETFMDLSPRLRDVPRFTNSQFDEFEKSRDGCTVSSVELEENSSRVKGLVIIDYVTTKSIIFFAP